ncbi:MAG: fibrobacter succinogenes major paralogous domain-containing protein [Flavobacteriales bacterium]|nr:fibrobacter succinogenes major paralogous domain-containing protein [Flavobacteriales bacterium]
MERIAPFLVMALVLVVACKKDEDTPDPAPTPTPTPQGVGDIDGNRYDTLTIGGLTWFTENLRVRNFRNGDPIPFDTSNAYWGTLETFCTVLDNDMANEDQFGLLYNYRAVTDPRGLCPDGWHPSTDGDWGALELALGMDPSEVGMNSYPTYGERGVAANVSGKLKALQLWPTLDGTVTNSSGNGRAAGPLSRATTRRLQHFCERVLLDKYFRLVPAAFGWNPWCDPPVPRAKQRHARGGLLLPLREGLIQRITLTRPQPTPEHYVQGSLHNDRPSRLARIVQKGRGHPRPRTHDHTHTSRRGGHRRQPLRHAFHRRAHLVHREPARAPLQERGQHPVCVRQRAMARRARSRAVQCLPERRGAGALAWAALYRGRGAGPAWGLSGGLAPIHRR